MKNFSEETILERAAVVWYYECKKLPVKKIAYIMGMDEPLVRSILHENCFEFTCREREENARLNQLKKNKKWEVANGIR